MQYVQICGCIKQVVMHKDVKTLIAGWYVYFTGETLRPTHDMSLP